MKITRIAESINVMSKTLGPAMKGRDPKPIQEMAIKLTRSRSFISKGYKNLK